MLPKTTSHATSSSISVKLLLKKLTDIHFYLLAIQTHIQSPVNISMCLVINYTHAVIFFHPSRLLSLLFLNNPHFLKMIIIYFIFILHSSAAARSSIFYLCALLLFFFSLTFPFGFRVLLHYVVIIKVNDENYLKKK